MPHGIGTYGSKRGRPPEKKAGGGKVKKMKHGGGTCRGMGKAKRGGKYSRSG